MLLNYEERPVIGKTMVVTGATSGIGLEIARALTRRCAWVVLLARDQAKADKVAASLRPIASHDPGVVIGGPPRANCEASGLVRSSHRRELNRPAPLAVAHRCFRTCRALLA